MKKKKRQVKKLTKKGKKYQLWINRIFLNYGLWTRLKNRQTTVTIVQRRFSDKCE